MIDRNHKAPFRFNIPSDAKVVKCRDCGAETFWVVNKNGKWVMVDQDGICHWEEGRCKGDRK